MDNIDAKVVRDFGREWGHFDQAELPSDEAQRIFDCYFAVFPWSSLPSDAVGVDVGCGSGRWAKLVAPRVGKLVCIDPSPQAAEVARRNLADCPNCTVEIASANTIPHADETFDFGYSLGVLHHAPNTQDALTGCIRKLKPDAPFLLYLYYAFDHRPVWFNRLWKMSELCRALISRMPSPIKMVATTVVATLVYWPLARTAKLLERLGLEVSSFPLAFYRNASFYTMRTDALDRFGTRLEQRFTRKEIEEMMLTAGLRDICFSANEPYWCAVGVRSAP